MYHVMFNVKSADLVSWMTPIEIEFDNWMTKTVISPWIFVDAVILDHGNFGWSWLAEVSRGIRMNFQETRWTSIPVDGDLEGSDHNDFCFILVKDGEILLNHHSPSSPRKVVHFKNLIKMSYCEHPALFGAFLGDSPPVCFEVRTIFHHQPGRHRDFAWLARCPSNGSNIGLAVGGGTFGYGDACVPNIHLRTDRHINTGAVHVHIVVFMYFICTWDTIYVVTRDWIRSTRCCLEFRYAELQKNLFGQTIPARV